MRRGALNYGENGYGKFDRRHHECTGMPCGERRRTSRKARAGERGKRDLSLLSLRIWICVLEEAEESALTASRETLARPAVSEYGTRSD